MEVTLKLPLDSVNLILGTLGEAPYKLSSPLIDNIKAQVVPQLRAATPEPAPSSSKKKKDSDAEF